MSVAVPKPVAIITAAIYALLRCNAVTRISVDQFSVELCAIGYFCGFTMAGINPLPLFPLSVPH